VLLNRHLYSVDGSPRAISSQAEKIAGDLRSDEPAPPTWRVPHCARVTPNTFPQTHPLSMPGYRASHELEVSSVQSAPAASRRSRSRATHGPRVSRLLLVADDERVNETRPPGKREDTLSVRRIVVAAIIATGLAVGGVSSVHGIQLTREATVISPVPVIEWSNEARRAIVPPGVMDGT
jgi:hypothetical protein